jgi:hypothetical protein
VPFASTTGDCHNAVTPPQSARQGKTCRRTPRFPEPNSIGQDAQVTSNEPFRVLGLDPTATVDDLRQARRRLALLAHPDVGGDASQMSALNAAYDAAMAIVLGTQAVEQPIAPVPRPRPRTRTRTRTGPRRRFEHDPASFVVHCLAVDAFEALSVAVSWYGEIVDDEPPYRLIAVLGEPSPCWCRLDLVSDAGATTVDLTIGAYESGDLPTAQEVRDLLVGAVNQLGEQFGEQFDEPIDDQR